jgi:putative transposase
VVISSEEIAMRKARFTEHEIIAVLRCVEVSYYNWKAKYGAMQAADIK